MANKSALLACLSLLPLLGACATGPVALPGPTVSAPVPAMGQSGYLAKVQTDYPLFPSDQISVSVFREPDLSVDTVTVSASGTVSLPLLGDVPAQGRTPSQLQANIQDMLAAKYLRDPHVSVNVVAYGSHMVTVDGAVTKPGVYPFLPGTRLSGAVALAQGLSRVAKSRELAIFRETPTGVEVAKFDYGAVSSGTMLDPVLQPGDRVVVGTNGLSQFWQDLLKALPAFALFTRL